MSRGFLAFGRVVFGVGFGLGGVTVDALLPNPSFEIAGASPGLAASWLTIISSGGDLIADFSETTTPNPIESFDGASWGSSGYVWVPTGDAAIFDTLAFVQPTRIETFARWSGHSFYSGIVSGGSAAEFNSSTLTVERFTAADWGTVPYVGTVAGAAMIEDFESGWTDPYVTEVIGGTAATFGPSADTIESFEHVLPDLLVVVDVGGNTFSKPDATPHGISNGDRRLVISDAGLPGGTGINQNYYVVGATSTTLQLSKSIGGSPIDLLDEGTGSIYLRGDASTYWTGPDTF